jgi:hypothetical protein
VRARAGCQGRHPRADAQQLSAQRSTASSAAVMSAPKHFRLALLVCDTLMPTVAAAHGEYAPIFDALLRASVPQRVTYDLKPYDVVRAMEYPPEDAEMDGVLLTGSGASLSFCMSGLMLRRRTAASAYEPVEWIDKLVAYAGRLVRERPTVKLFGVCTSR